MSNTSRIIATTLQERGITPTPSTIRCIVFDGEQALCFNEEMLDAWWAGMPAERKAEVFEMDDEASAPHPIQSGPAIPGLTAPTEQELKVIEMQEVLDAYASWRCPMRLSNVTNAKLQVLAEGHRRIGKPQMAGLLDELIDRRTDEHSERRDLERDLAFNAANSILDTNCRELEIGVGGWHDLRDAPEEARQAIADAVRYLDLRGLIQRAEGDDLHVAVLDESEATA